MNVTVKLTPQALRHIMGDAFNFDEFDRGRKDLRDFAKKATYDEFAAKLEEVKDILGRADFVHRPGPSYWLGGLSEFEFVVWPKKGESEGDV